MKIDPFDNSDTEKVFRCIKCKDYFEYDEFFKHDDPTFDYGFFIINIMTDPIGVQIVDDVILCQSCVPVMSFN